MYKIIVAGSGTDVGKTVVSAILVTALEADYWKPIQSGPTKDLDSVAIKKIIDVKKHCVLPPAYSLKAPLSPHHASRLEGITIDVNTIVPPKTLRPLIIESAGGVFVPLTPEILSIDLFQSWNFKWIIVSRHYLGSINHTLLTLEVLKQRNIPVAGIVFNGDPNPDSESVILEMSRVPLLGRLHLETNLNLQTIQRYAKEWQPRLHQLIH